MPSLSASLPRPLRSRRVSLHHAAASSSARNACPSPISCDGYTFFSGLVLTFVSLEMWISFSFPVPRMAMEWPMSSVHLSHPESTRHPHRPGMSEISWRTPALRAPPETRENTVAESLVSPLQQYPVKPRVIRVMSSSVESLIHEEQQEIWTPVDTPRSVEPLGGPCPYCHQEMDAYRWPMEQPFYEQCTPMADWQTTFYPTCNPLHELDLLRVGSNAEDEDDHDHDSLPYDHISLLSLQGSWRTVWKVHQAPHASHNATHPRPLARRKKATAVLKLLKFEKREFDHESFGYHTVEAMALERLTRSPFIMDIYGFCGQSVLTEYATGSARMHLKDTRFTALDRLTMARDLARALADLHSIDYPNSTNATLAHNDMNIANAVEVNGHIKLNDLNIGILMRWNGTQACGSPVRFEAKMWKSPEENRNISYVNPALADVYGLGNLLFQVLTTRQPWTHLEPDGPLHKDQVVQRKLAGQIPYLPPDFLHSNQTAVHALAEATLACFRPHPPHRLSSHQLAEALHTALQWATRKVSVSRDQVRHLFAIPASTEPSPFLPDLSSSSKR